MVGLIFFVPTSPTFKSIFLVLALIAVACNEDLRGAFFSALRLPVVYCSIALFLLFLVSCLWSPADLKQQGQMLDKYSKLLVFPVLVAGFYHKKTRQWAQVAFLCAMFLTSLIAIAQKFGWLNLHGTGLVDPGFVFHSHIMTGFMLAYASYCSFWAFFKKELPLSPWIYLVLALLFTYVVFFVNVGRTGYFIYFLLALLFCIQCFSIKQSLIAVLVCLTGFSLMYSVQGSLMRKNINLLYSSYEQYSENQKSTSLGYRMQFHSFALKLFKQQPLWGHGLGSFPFLYEQDRPVKDWRADLLEPHSEYWLVAVQQGVLGLLFLSLFFLSFFFCSKYLSESLPQLVGITLAFMLGCISDSLLLYGGSGYFFLSFAAVYFGELVETAHTQKVSFIPNAGQSLKSEF